MMKPSQILPADNSTLEEKLKQAEGTLQKLNKKLDHAILSGNTREAEVIKKRITEYQDSIYTLRIMHYNETAIQDLWNKLHKHTTQDNDCQACDAHLDHCGTMCPDHRNQATQRRAI